MLYTYVKMLNPLHLLRFSLHCFTDWWMHNNCWALAWFRIAELWLTYSPFDSLLLHTCITRTHSLPHPSKLSSWCRVHIPMYTIGQVSLPLAKECEGHMKIAQVRFYWPFYCIQIIQLLSCNSGIDLKIKGWEWSCGAMHCHLSFGWT